MNNKKLWKFYLVVSFAIIIAVVVVIASGSISKLDNTHVDSSFLVLDQVASIEYDNFTRMVIVDDNIIDIFNISEWKEKIWTPSVDKEISINFTPQDGSYSIGFYPDGSSIRLLKDSIAFYYNIPKSSYKLMLEYIDQYDHSNMIENMDWDVLNKESWISSFSNGKIINLRFFDEDGRGYCSFEIFDPHDGGEIMTQFSSPVLHKASRRFRLILPHWFKWESMSSGSEKLEYYDFAYMEDVIQTYALEFLTLSKNHENSFDDEDMRRIAAKKESFELLRDIANANIYTGAIRESVVQRFLVNTYEDRIIISEIVFIDNFVSDDGSKLIYLMTDEISLNGTNTTLTSANAFAKVYYRNSYFIEEIILLDDYETKAIEQNESVFADNTIFDIQKEVFLAMEIMMDEHRARIVGLNSPQLTDSNYKDWYYLFALSNYADTKTIDGAIRKYYLLHEYDITMLETVAWHEYKREEYEDKATLYVSIFSNYKHGSNTNIGNNFAIIQLSKIYDGWVVNIVNYYGDSSQSEELHQLFEENKGLVLQKRLDEWDLDYNDLDGDGKEDEYNEGETFFDKLSLLDNEEMKQEVGVPIGELNMIDKQIDDEIYDFSFLYD